MADGQQKNFSLTRLEETKLSNNDYYQQVGQLLYNISPDGAKKVIMRARLAPEEDVGTFEYDYINEAGDTAWFVGGGKTNTEMLKLLILLRHEYIDRGETAWNSCEFIVDIEKSEFKIIIDER